MEEISIDWSFVVSLQDSGGIIYKITNIHNNKKYIGLTTKTAKKRWDQHVATANGDGKDSKAIFKKAIRKYGTESWVVETIDSADTLEELKQKEIYWIEELNTYAFDKNGWGYNSTRGGDLVGECCCVKVVQCDIPTGKVINIYNSLTEAGEAIGCRVEFVEKENHSCGGFCFLFYDNIKGMTKREIADKVHSLYPTLVYQLDLKGNIVNIFKDTTEATRSIGKTNAGNLINCCLGNRRVCKGYQWVYQRDIADRVGVPVEELPVPGLAVVQYGLNGKKIRKWDNITRACEETGALDSHISQCCKGIRQQTGGYQWRYAREEIDELPEIFTKRPVICIETGERFPTAAHAARHFNYSSPTIINICKGKPTKKEYHFRWE
jgi:hypothetical protein